MNSYLLFLICSAYCLPICTACAIVLVPKVQVPCAIVLKCWKCARGAKCNQKVPGNWNSASDSVQEFVNRKSDLPSTWILWLRKEKLKFLISLDDLIRRDAIRRLASSTARVTSVMATKHQWQSNKGSHPERKVQFFLTLFKRPLTPPPPFVWTSCGEFFWRNFNKSA